MIIFFKKQYIDKILRGEKTQTRRLGKRLYRVGQIYQISGGVKIQITKRWQERLGDISESDLQKEGFETFEEFKREWEKIYGYWDPDAQVWVYEFRVVSRKDKVLLETKLQDYL